MAQQGSTAAKESRVVKRYEDEPQAAGAQGWNDDYAYGDEYSDSPWNDDGWNDSAGWDESY